MPAAAGQSLAGQDDRGLGTRIQGRDRRHAGEPVDSADRGLLAAGGRVRAHDPKAMDRARQLFRGRDSLCPRSLLRVERGRRAGGRDRVAGLPQSRFRADEELLAQHRWSSMGGISTIPGAMQTARLRLCRHRSARHREPAMRLLITGAAGFLGSHLVDRLLAEGHGGRDGQFRDRQSGQYRPPRGAPGLRPSAPRCQRDTFSVEGPLDGILHFASPASPIDYLELPIQTLKVGSLGTHNASGSPSQRGAVLPGLHLRGVRRSRWSIPSRRVTGATSIRSAPGVSTTRPSGSPKPSPWPTIATMAWIPGSSGSSIPTARGCGPGMAGWFPTSSCRRLSGEPVTIYGSGPRPDHSATSVISSMGSTDCF